MEDELVDQMEKISFDECKQFILIDSMLENQNKSIPGSERKKLFKLIKITIDNYARYYTYNSEERYSIPRDYISRSINHTYLSILNDVDFLITFSEIPFLDEWNNNSQCIEEFIFKHSSIQNDFPFLYT
jgi:hypothetical protein